MKRKYVLKNKKRFYLFISTTALAVCIALFAVSAYGYKEPSCREITIMQGDTLWDIARRYNTKDDIREYIYKIKKINNLSSSNIYAGSKIKIPVS